MANKEWSYADLDLLRKFYRHSEHTELEELLKRTWRSIATKASELNLKRKAKKVKMSYVIKVIDTKDETIVCTRKVACFARSNREKDRRISELKIRFMAQIVSGQYVMTITNGFEGIRSKDKNKISTNGKAKNNIQRRTKTS